MPLNVLIIDDEPMARERIRDLLENETDIHIAGECRNGIEAVEAIQNQKPDLVFLDIQMPGMNGLDVLTQLRKDDLPEIVFVTAYDQYTLQAFSAHALDYLLKPYDDERFHEALQYAKNRIDHKRNNVNHHPALLSLIGKLEQKEKYLRRIQVKLNRKIVLLNVDQVDSLEAEGSYVRIRSGENCYLLRESLNNFENKLDPNNFVRIHRSTIVNIDSIKELQHWSKTEWIALMKNNTKYTISRKCREKLSQMI